MHDDLLFVFGPQRSGLERKFQSKECTAELPIEGSNWLGI